MRQRLSKQRLDRWVLVGVTLLAATRAASADRYEAVISARPIGTLAQLEDDGGGATASVAGGGFAGSVGYGLRNWLDLTAELGATVLGQARHPGTTLPLSGTPQMGELVRTTRLGHATVGATLRLGVSWVPFVHGALGVGFRQRSAASLRTTVGEFAPDDQGSELTLDVIAALRVGLEHRLTRRITVGVSAGVTERLGLGAPSLVQLEASVALAYVWYPNWGP